MADRAPALDLDAKKSVLRQLTYGLYVVTVAWASEEHGFTANWLSQVSFEPPLIAVSVENDSHAIDLLRTSGLFGVNVLDSSSREIAGSMGRKWRNVGDKLGEVAHHPGLYGCPVLEDALGMVECRVVGAMPCGDSTLFVGEVASAQVLNEGRPLTMAEAGFRHSG